MDKKHKSITQIEGLIEWSSDPSQRRKILEWLVRFIQTNIKKLGPLEKTQMGSEIDWYLRWFGVNIEGSPRDFILPPRDSKEYWKKITDFQAIIRKTLLGVLSLKKIGIRQHRAEVAYYLKEPSKDFNLVFIPRLSKFEDSFRLLFYRLLEGLPMTTLQECRACKKLFVNPSRREKHFCSPRCMWRFNAEKRRKADPEGYRKKQREIMNKRYEEKRKAQLGPNVKIKRRKRREV